MAMGSVSAEKDRLRQELRRLAAGLDPEFRKEADRRIAGQVLALPSWKTAKTVLAFVSLPREPDTRPLLEAALAEGKILLLPRCYGGGRMRAFPVQDLDALEPGRLGIPEPPDLPEPPEGDPEPDLILVPCVGATPDGKRLGNGAGYFDRYLAGHGGRKVCLCYRACLRGDLPRDVHDVSMDCVITD